MLLCSTDTLYSRRMRVAFFSRQTDAQADGRKKMSVEHYKP